MSYIQKSGYLLIFRGIQKCEILQYSLIVLKAGCKKNDIVKRPAQQGELEYTVNSNPTDTKFAILKADTSTVDIYGDEVL